MTWRTGLRAVLAGLSLTTGCAWLAPTPESGPPSAPATAQPPTAAAPAASPPSPAAPAPTGSTPATAAQPGRLPEAFESREFIVAIARPGDSSESLAARYLGDAGKAWMIEDYNGGAAVVAGRPVVVPRQPWNVAGVEGSGFQLVPVLVYHGIAPQSRGRLVLAMRSFEEQMRYLKLHGYHVITVRELYEFMSFRQQLPRKSVAITFDDGYRSFLDYAYPVLKELGFTATLFIYTDYVGAGRNALTWDELRRLDREGFDIQGHSKTHGDLRRRSGESEAEYAGRMKIELGDPQALFERHLGRRVEVLAYPYGYEDESLQAKVREYGYVAAFTVRREGNPSFVYPLRARRSQVYSEMTLDDFARNLNTYSPEPIR
jgi:peptidoglycan/xylan/chitin deacetylase (PgdA/CDA1 family)